MWWWNQQKHVEGRTQDVNCITERNKCASAPRDQIYCQQLLVSSLLLHNKYMHQSMITCMAGLWVWAHGQIFFADLFSMAFVWNIAKANSSFLVSSKEFNGCLFLVWGNNVKTFRQLCSKLFQFSILLGFNNGLTSFYTFLSPLFAGRRVHPQKWSDSHKCTSWSVFIRIYPIFILRCWQRSCQQIQGNRMLSVILFCVRGVRSLMCAYLAEWKLLRYLYRKEVITDPSSNLMPSSDGVNR